MGEVRFCEVEFLLACGLDAPGRGREGFEIEANVLRVASELDRL